MALYDAPVKTLKGEAASLKDYEGKTVLVVNVASKCGLTPQYTGLEQLHEKYKDKGFAVLGFPCNQFGGQEPGTAEEPRAPELIWNGAKITFRWSASDSSPIEAQTSVYTASASCTAARTGAFNAPSTSGQASITSSSVNPAPVASPSSGGVTSGAGSGAGSVTGSGDAFGR